jgi:hypothetical protein
MVAFVKTSVRPEPVEGPSFFSKVVKGRASTGSARTGRGFRVLGSLTVLLALSACARQSAAAVAAGGPGFLHGLWDGFVFPIAWAVSLFVPEVAVYAVPNNGGWYDFGYFLGIVVFGVGARGGTRIVYRTRTVRETRRAGVVEGRVIREDEE